MTTSSWHLFLVLVFLFSWLLVGLRGMGCVIILVRVVSFVLVGPLMLVFGIGLICLWVLR